MTTLQKPLAAFWALLATTLCCAQIPTHEQLLKDAQAIVQSKESGNNTEFIRLISPYCPDGCPENKLLHELKVKPKSGSTGQSNGTEWPNIEIPNLSTGIGFTDLAEGVTAFFIERTKAELTNVLIHQLYTKTVHSENNSIYEKTFPITFLYMKERIAHQNTAYYSSDFELLKEYTKKDLNHLPLQLAKERNSFFKDKALLNALSLYDDANSNKSISTIIRTNPIFNNHPIQAWVETLPLFREALTEISTSYPYTSKLANNTTLTISIQNQPEKQAYWGLVYALMEQNHLLKQLLAKRPYDFKNNAYISAIAIQLEQLNTLNSYAISWLNTEDKKPLQAINKVEITYNRLNDLILACKQIDALFQETIGTMHGEKYEPFSFENTDKWLSTVKVFIDDVPFKLKMQTLLEVYQNELTETLIANKTLTLLTEIADCNSGQEVQYILETYTLPIGSSSIKRNSELNIALNAYVGLTAGWEQIALNGNDSSALNVGLSAPLGVATTFAQGKWTAFLSVLDFGNLVNKRLSDEHEFESNLRVEQLFSMGLGLYYNLKNYPISFGVHGSYLPNYAQYSAGEFTKNTEATRVNFAVLVDIPLFNLFHR